MDGRKALLLIMLACVLLSVVMEVNGKKKKKKPSRGKPKPHDHHDHHGSKDLDDELHRLEQSIEALQVKVDDLSSKPGEHDSDSHAQHDSDSHVHLHFHGDEHDHDDDDDETRVDVYLHTDGHGGRRRGHRDHSVVAHCELTNTNIAGSVHIVHEADENHANFLFSFDHLGDADTEHALHVHEFGDLSNGCKSLGKHFNPPHGNRHAGPGEKTEFIPSDMGDLGKITTDSDGAIVGEWNNDTHLCLVGPHSIMGRSIIVHDTDGSHLGCCVIGLVSMGDDDHHHGDKRHGDHDHDKHHEGGKKQVEAKHQH